jgi:hypothetical protein
MEAEKGSLYENGNHEPSFAAVHVEFRGCHLSSVVPQHEGASVLLSEFFSVLAHSLDLLQAHRSLVSAWLLNKMPGEDRQRGTRSAPSADNNGNGQPNKNTTDTAKAKTSSEEGEVRAILVSALSEKSDRALGPCDSSDDARFTCSLHSATPPTLPTWRTTRNLRTNVRSERCDSAMPPTPVVSQLNQLKRGRKRRKPWPSLRPTR